MSANEERVRAFLAVSPSPQIHVLLVRLKEELAASGAAVRWVRDDGLHSTLKFLGSVQQGLLASMRRLLGAATTDFRPFPATVSRVGAFPNLERPRVVWVGLAAPELAPLAAAVERAVEPLGFAPESRPYRPHITLGRVKGRSGWQRLADLLEAHRDEEFGRFMVDRVVAYRSHLQRGGSVYTELWNIPLLVNGNGGGTHGT